MRDDQQTCQFSSLNVGYDIRQNSRFSTIWPLKPIF